MGTQSAFWLSLYVSASYVVAIYTTSRGLEEYPSGRDDPRVIRRRIGRISLVTLANMLVVPWLIVQLGYDGPKMSVKRYILDLGIVPGYYRDGHWDISNYLWDITKAIGLMALLYVGPLADGLLYYATLPNKHLYTDLRAELFNVWGLRNYLFAPVSEEIIYTSMLINNYLILYPQGQCTLSTIVWKVPLFFGVAHLHHAYEMHQQGLTGVVQVICNAAIQMTYTTLFGSLTNYAFVKSGGNLWVCILLHVMCNFMGFPEASKVVMHHTVVKKSDSVYVKKLLDLWKKCYLALLLMGLLFFKNKFTTLLNSSGNQIVL